MAKGNAGQPSGNGRMRVGVILGGMSSEREISLESGRHVFHNLDPAKYVGVPIFMDLEGRLWEIALTHLVQNTTSDIADRLDEATPIPYEDLRERIDFAFIGLHGKYGEDGCLQGMLELIGVPYNGSGVLGSAIGMDKAFQRRVLAAAGLRVPKHLAVSEEDWEQRNGDTVEIIEDTIGYPCVVKPTREGCSTGLSVVREAGQLAPAVEAALAWDRACLIEELLQGIEVTTTVIGNQELEALLPTETPAQGEFLTVEEKFLPGEGEMITPARLPDELLRKVQNTAVEAFRALGLRVYARFDAFVEDGEVVITEPNTLPGLTPSTMVFHQAAEAGMDPIQFIDRVIQLSLQAHAEKKGPLA